MTFLSALLLGLLGSAHCALMCGGLQSTLQHTSVVRSAKQARQRIIALNLGRLCVYVAAGAIFSTIGVSIIKFIDIPQISRIARYATAAILLLIGIQLLFANKKPFAFFESAGASLWGVVHGYLPTSDNDKLSTSFRYGVVWGFLPCGLVYGVLLTTLLAENSVQGALIMLGFGIGTVPALVLTGGFYLKLRELVQNKVTQWFGAAIFIQGGILMIVAPWFISTEFMNAYPELMSTVFCFSRP